MQFKCPTIKRKITVPLLHIAEVAGNAVKERAVRSVVCLALNTLWKLDFYTDILKNRFGIGSDDS